MSKDRHEVAGQNLAKVSSDDTLTLTLTLTPDPDPDPNPNPNPNLAKVSIEDIFSNPAYMGIFRKFMTRTADEEPENRDAYAMSLAMFELFMDVQDYKSEPDPAVLRDMGGTIYDNFLKRGGPMTLSCFSDADRSEIRAALDASQSVGEARTIDRRLPLPLTLILTLTLTLTRRARSSMARRSRRSRPSRTNATRASSPRSTSRTSSSSRPRRASCPACPTSA